MVLNWGYALCMLFAVLFVQGGINYRMIALYSNHFVVTLESYE